MIEASCHCGSVKIDLPRKPRTLTDCNCSICRRYGARWAYYQAAEVRVRGRRAALSSYLWASGAFASCDVNSAAVSPTGWEQETLGRVGWA
jgi:hypothetical protein